MPDGHGQDRFVLLLARNHRRIFGFIRTLVPSRTDADDVFQETCAVLWREFPNFRPDADFAPWALAIAYNQVRSHRHRARRLSAFVSGTLLQELVAEEERQSGLQQVRAEALEACLQQLPDSDQAVIDTYYGGSGTARDAAQILGRPVNTVYKALQRIRGGLYECIEAKVAAEGA